VTKPVETHPYFKSFVALLLIAGCLWASQWQFHRGEDRKARNDKIELRISQSEGELESLIGDVAANEWRTVTTSGRFDPANQILLRNRYFEGKYGYGVLTRFTSEQGKVMWVDRGWVQAGASATVVPQTPEVPSGPVSIVARLRLDSSLPSGSFFALPSSGETGLLSRLNAQSGLESENYYLDLISGSDPLLIPKAPAEVPSLSDGPHLAYAVQWALFAALVLYGRYLIRKMDLTSGEVLPAKEI
jgi:cytochrome oxidase assembly protein ShyY1